METITVLYVDDEQDSVEISSYYLGRSGLLKVRTAASAPEALAMLEAEPCDAVVSDYQMPEMDGLELLAALRRRHPDTAFILLTARGREEVVIEALSNGADFYIQKSAEPLSLYAELEHKIRQAVEARRTNSALRRSRELLRMLVEGAGDPIFSIDRGGTYLYVNPAFAKPFGKRPEEIIGATMWDVFPKEEADIRFRGLSKVVETGREERIEVKVTTVEGEHTYYATTINPLHDDEGEISGVLCISKNITERRRAEESLRESEAVFRSLADHAEALIMFFDEDGPVYVNPSVTRVLGYTLEELRTLKFSILHPDYVEPVMERAMARRRGEIVPDHLESVMITKSGQARCFAVTASVVERAGRLITVIVAADITDMKALEEHHRTCDLTKGKERT